MRKDGILWTVALGLGVVLLPASFLGVMYGYFADMYGTMHGDLKYAVYAVFGFIPGGTLFWIGYLQILQWYKTGQMAAPPLAAILAMVVRLSAIVLIGVSTAALTKIDKLARKQEPRH